MNSKRIIYKSYQPYALEYAKHMQKDFGWEPVYWSLIDGFENDVKNCFPNTYLNNYHDEIKGKLPLFITEDELASIDSAFLKSMAYQESIALNMMSRNCLLIPFSYQDRFRLYIRLVRFYCTLLDKLRPDIIIFEDSPHEACDYILYHIAQKKGINTILFEASALPKYFLPMNNYEYGYKKMIDAYKKACSFEVLPDFKLSLYTLDEIKKKKGDYSLGIPYYMLNQQKIYSNIKTNLFQKFISKNILILIKILNISKLKNRLNFVLSLNKPSVFSYLKQKNTSFEKSEITNWEFLYRRKRIEQIKKHNLLYYKENENKNPDLHSDFIFCPLHYQPEKTSSPWGGYYVNQILMIQVLSKSIPNGWKIFVKEHVSQFVFPGTGEEYRNEQFYDDIRKLSNVELIPIEFKSFDLIDNAKAVASVSGTVLWESVLRGKPAMAFGEGHHSWCGGCEGVFYTPESENIKEVISKIQNGYSVNQEKVLLYAHFIEQYGYKGYAGGNAQAVYSGISMEENALLHVRAIKELLSV